MALLWIRWFLLMKCRIVSSSNSQTNWTSVHLPEVRLQTEQKHRTMTFVELPDHVYLTSIDCVVTSMFNFVISSFPDNTFYHV